MKTDFADKKNRPFVFISFNTGLPGRNSYSLIEYKGAKMTLYKLPYSYELKKISAHTPVKDITVSEDMKVTKEPLPKGQYMYRFVVRDVFGNRIVSGNLMPVKNLNKMSH